MRGQKRPQSEKIRALGIAAVDGVAAASRETGIAESTIQQWTHDPDFAELRARTKEAATEEWWGIVQQAFRRTAELLDKTEDPVKAATAGAIVFDKMALSRGEATARSESKDITDDIPVSVKRQLRRRFADLAGDPGDGVAAESAHGAEASAG